MSTMKTEKQIIPCAAGRDISAKVIRALTQRNLRITGKMIL